MTGKDESSWCSRAKPSIPSVQQLYTSFKTAWAGGIGRVVVVVVDLGFSWHTSIQYSARDKLFMSPSLPWYQNGEALDREPAASAFASLHEAQARETTTISFTQTFLLITAPPFYVLLLAESTRRTRRNEHVQQHPSKTGQMDHQSNPALVPSQCKPAAAKEKRS